MPRREAGTEFDWAGARRRLADAELSLTAGDAAAADAVMRRRAAALAAPRQAELPEPTAAMVGFERGGQRYALELSELQEVIVGQAITPLPGVPSFYLGLVQHRGDIWPVIEVAAVAGLAIPESGPPSALLLLGEGGSYLALAADAIDTVTEVKQSVLAAASLHQRSGPLRGHVAELGILLDAARLLNDARLVVEAEPAPMTHEEEAL